MPARVSPKNLVARPDRVDFRDRAYAPPLRSLPAHWPPRHIIDRNLAGYRPYILDQGSEGACTGFGLAAVINFIYWSAWRERQIAGNGAPEEAPPQVSPHMLYHNARLYDEWEGSDYEGSSCRGAMKGWHKHGACGLDLWVRSAKTQAPAWREDAAKRPLGAYYRVDAKSIADMQAAIYEVRSLYCSADVHEGWTKPADRTVIDDVPIARIRHQKKLVGGHAFALIGYTPEGFIVQNSWGPGWGTHGFAILTYQDWIENGYDAWVAAVGAPMSISAPDSAGRGSLASAVMSSGLAKSSKAANLATAAIQPWSEGRAYEHAIVVGNDGKLMQRLVGSKDAETALKFVLDENVKAKGHANLALYVHGGLNSEDAAIKRVRKLGPWFDANGIHPVFVIWRTGLMESLSAIAADEIAKYEDKLKELRSKGIGEIVEKAVDALKEAKDRAFEVAAEKLIGKAVWTQIKQNAAMASPAGKLLPKIAGLIAAHGDMQKHLLGHSAGSLVIGHLLDAAAGKPGVNFASCGLYAPACTMRFAVDMFGKAMSKDAPLGRGKLTIDALTDVAEVNDTVGPYGKSLLYLVSRALESVHKMPLLGLELALANGAVKKPGMELADELKKVQKAWKERLLDTNRVEIRMHAGPKIRTSTTQRETIAHGTFDNDIDVVNASLVRILGLKSESELPRRITDLAGF